MRIIALVGYEYKLKGKEENQKSCSCVQLTCVNNRREFPLLQQKRLAPQETTGRLAIPC